MGLKDQYPQWDRSFQVNLFHRLLRMVQCRRCRRGYRGHQIDQKPRLIPFLPCVLGVPFGLWLQRGQGYHLDPGLRLARWHRTVQEGQNCLLVQLDR